MIHCTKCGAKTRITTIAHQGQSMYADAMNQMARVRRCVNACDREFIRTTELLTSELQELRRKAYLSSVLSSHG